MIDPSTYSSRAAEWTILPRVLIAVLIAGLALTTPRLSFAAYQGSSDAEQQERFNQAVQAYTQNRFTDARTLFEGVRGSHSEEAKKYLVNINAYREAIEVADNDMRRSPDELDAANLNFAIEKYREAIAIKSDGPWNPKEKLDKAMAQKARLLQQSGSEGETRKQKVCDKLAKASAARLYDQAKYLACFLANEDPGYSCGRDEALYLCQQMTALAQIGSRPPGSVPKTPDGLPASIPSDGKTKSAFDRAKAAFDANDFEKARIAFQKVAGEEKESAQEYVGKIGQYQNSIKLGAKLSQDGKYEEARAAYQDAAKIKPDGPGNPQEQAAVMVLHQGVSEFYAGNYNQASQSLADYVQNNTQKADIAHFYMGASELASFFLAGGRDGSLREQALGDFRKAKDAGFLPKDLEVSPKILKVYNELAF